VKNLKDLGKCTQRLERVGRPRATNLSYTEGIHLLKRKGGGGISLNIINYFHVNGEANNHCWKIGLMYDVV